ncbi:hypothetical protein ACFY2R_05545 [Micromonospora olivasterospora]|uniref:Uncharacterized protein n=1 Tax=Micromonospora olivasterospora TaxID=1880 RepID=A0A562II07_MICOL|nr:hypothetical protein [Micromonospora olivasterospora]TWH70458.1 hypothetical protein JD77_05483 [Micromonospora olivasterospora]
MPEEHLEACNDDGALGVDALQIMARRYVERRVAQLSARPEDADARLRGLLDIYDDLAGRGHPDPLALLASVLGIPVDTLVIYLRAAGRAP